MRDARKTRIVMCAGTLQNLLGGPKNPGETPQEQAQQPNPVQQILGLFGKKKQDNDQQK